MASSVIRLVFHKVLSINKSESEGGGGIVKKNYSLVRKVLNINKQSESPANNAECVGWSHRTTASHDRPSPWLMLPPAGGSDNVYKFYSLADRKVLRKKRESAAESAECVGSSHGWIALFNRRNNDLFLWNPLSGRHIKLPSMERIHDPHTARKWGPAKVLKFVLSSSPEDKKCCAMMIYGPLHRLAYCFPGDSTRQCKWTPIGERFGDDSPVGKNAPVHQDLAYCKVEEWFSTMDAFGSLNSAGLLNYDYHRRGHLRLSIYGRLSKWDPWYQEPVDPWAGESLEYSDLEDDERENNTLSWVKENAALLKHKCIQIPHIVHVDGSDHPYIAIQLVMLMNPDDATTPVDTLPKWQPRFEGKEGYYPSKTVGFVVLKLDTDDWAEMSDNDIVDDLDGLAMFVGTNHSFALPALDFPELKPDSIYFTDSKRIKNIDGSSDVGVFDYRNKTVHGIDIFHGRDGDMDMDRRDSSSSSGVFKPSPLWFTPAAHS